MPEEEQIITVADQLRTFGDVAKREAAVTRELNKALGVKEEERPKPPVTFLGTKPMPVQVIRDEVGPEGGRIIELERCYETTVRREDTGEEKTIPVCHQVAHVFDETTLECIQELPQELLERLPPQRGQPPTAREKVRAAVACSDESANEVVISLLTGLDRGEVREQLSNLRRECRERGEPENCIVENPPAKDVSAKIRVERTPPKTVIVPQKELDPLGLTLYQMNSKQREVLKTDLCGTPCIRLRWWRKAE